MWLYVSLSERIMSTLDWRTHRQTHTLIVVSKKCVLQWSCRMMDVYLVLEIMSLPTRGPGWPWIIRLQHIFPPFCYNSVSVFFFYHFLIPSLTFVWQPHRKILSEVKLFCVCLINNFEDCLSFHRLKQLGLCIQIIWLQTFILHAVHMPKSNFVCKWYANPSCYLLWRADQQINSQTHDSQNDIYSISPFSKRDCCSVPVTVVPELYFVRLLFS